jgi:UDP-N-acetylglucosamine--N-acetylmuramyl-(pentapeptide) pyrophosphoryl-undecaprenol N-acetylglucosamine transferase
MEFAYAAADLVICRGGALTVAEVAAVGRAALVVPYPWHRDRHQYRNGAALGAGAVVLDQEDLPRRLAPAVGELLADPGRRAAMAAAARASLPQGDTDLLLDDLAAHLHRAGKPPR